MPIDRGISHPRSPPPRINAEMNSPTLQPASSGRFLYQIPNRSSSVRWFVLLSIFFVTKHLRLAGFRSGSSLMPCRLINLGLCYWGYGLWTDSSNTRFGDVDQCNEFLGVFRPKKNICTPFTLNSWGSALESS